MNMVGHQAVRVKLRLILDYQVSQVEQIKNEIVVVAEAGTSIRRSLHNVRGDAGKEKPWLSRHDDETFSRLGRLTSSVPDPDLRSVRSVPDPDL